MIKRSGIYFSSCLVGVLLLGGCSDQSSNQAKPATGQVVVGAAVPNVKVNKWGAQGTVAGKGFSIQPNGSSALWFELSGPVNGSNIEVWFGDSKLSGVAILVSQEGGSAEIPPALLKDPRKVPVYLIEKITGKKIDIGIFEITPAS